MSLRADIGFPCFGESPPISPFLVVSSRLDVFPVHFNNFRAGFTPPRPGSVDARHARGTHPGENTFFPETLSSFVNIQFRWKFRARSTSAGFLADLVSPLFTPYN
jgi:hypothetical protein